MPEPPPAASDFEHGDNLPVSIPRNNKSTRSSNVHRSRPSLPTKGPHKSRFASQKPSEAIPPRSLDVSAFAGAPAPSPEETLVHESEDTTSAFEMQSPKPADVFEIHPSEPTHTFELQPPDLHRVNDHVDVPSDMNYDANDSSFIPRYPPSPTRGPSEVQEEACDDESDVSEEVDDGVVRAELPYRWIPTLSMRFRDGTRREKFFVTYLRKPNDWLRVSISVDYDKAQEGSLEQDLESLGYQKDKNFYIYKAVRQSLDEIGWFDTVTNLRLETIDERLHIHVAEDANERIPYPALKLLDHLRLEFHGYLIVNEDQVIFESHVSGFVYRVRVDGRVYVKKEITSTDTVQEFIYEIEALAALRESRSVVDLVGVVVSELDGVARVTGVLIEWASRGALNDFFFDNSESDIDWNTRLTWVGQVIQGIADIHEAGFVQGDCTLSNIVLDSDGKAKFVDINRRGCPIGWEPPEFRGMIRSGQRISMYIGVKSDLYQLGMVLWAIAMQVEEPDRAEQPFVLDDPSIPRELVAVIESCLADEPKLRKSATKLLTMLPGIDESAAELPPLKSTEVAFPTVDDLALALPSLEQMEDANKTLYLPHFAVESTRGPKNVSEAPSEATAGDLVAFGLFDCPPSLEEPQIKRLTYLDSRDSGFHDGDTPVRRRSRGRSWEQSKSDDGRL